MEVNDGITICRLCLNGNGSLMYIFESKVSRGGVPADVIIELLQFEVSEGDKYPQFVCAECVTKLEDFKQYKERCITCKELLDQAYASKHIFVSGTGPSGVEGSSDALLMGEPSPLLPNERPHLLVEQPNSWDTLTIKQEEEAVQDSNEDPLACDGYEDIPYSSVFKALGSHEEEAVKEEFQNEIEENNNDGMPSILEWEVVPGKPITESTGEKCVVKGDLKHFWNTNIALDSNGQKGEGIRIICPGCHKEFVHILEHLINTKLHEQQGTIKCDRCEIYFACPESLEHHMPYHTVQSLSCGICDKTFQSKHRLMCHMSTHRERRFKCEVCGKSLFSLNLLENHMRNHSKRKNERFVMTKSTCSGSNRIGNKHSKKDIKPRKYGCNQCFQMFVTISEVSFHIRCHVGLKPFPCPLCGLELGTKCDLYRHFKLEHSGCRDAEYQCVDCGLQSVNAQNTKYK